MPAQVDAGLHKAPVFSNYDDDSGPVEASCYRANERRTAHLATSNEDRKAKRLAALKPSVPSCCLRAFTSSLPPSFPPLKQRGHRGCRMHHRRRHHHYHQHSYHHQLLHAPTPSPSIWHTGDARQISRALVPTIHYPLPSRKKARQQEKATRIVCAANSHMRIPLSPPGTSRLVPRTRARFFDLTSSKPSVSICISGELEREKRGNTRRRNEKATKRASRKRLKDRTQGWLEI